MTLTIVTMILFNNYETNIILHYTGQFGAKLLSTPTPHIGD